jgi:hypothetical protein
MLPIHPAVPIRVPRKPTAIHAPRIRVKVLIAGDLVDLDMEARAAAPGAIRSSHAGGGFVFATVDAESAAWRARLQVPAGTRLAKTPARSNTPITAEPTELTQMPQASTDRPRER